jgi:hypothetical protein
MIEMILYLFEKTWVESLDRRFFILSKFCIKPFKLLGVIMLSLNMTFHKVHVIADSTDEVNTDMNLAANYVTPIK